MSTPTPKIFVTGVTGYVGGDALSVLLSAHPTWFYTFLVRTESRVASLIAAHPTTPIRTIIGDLSDLSLLTIESSAADIVLHFASSDDVNAITAITAGIGSSASASASTPKFLIATSGTANLLFEDLGAGRFGEPGVRVWDDVADIAAINEWPDSVPHRPAERVVMDAHKTYPHLRTAVVCPPAIVGVGRGPGNTRTIQVPAVVEMIRKRGRAFKIGQGRSAWSFVHVNDLSDVYLRITEAAVAGGGSADWGRDGWYFVENGEREWGLISERIAKRLVEKGELESAEVDSITVEQAREMHMLIPATIGANSKSRATRTRKALGWEPKIENFESAIDELVDEELERGEGRLEELGRGLGPAPPNDKSLF